MSIQEQARRVREAKGLSQQEVANQAHIHRNQVQQFETGGNLTLETIEKLLGPLGLSLVLIAPDDVATAREALRGVDRFLAILQKQASRTAATSSEPPSGSPNAKLRQTIRDLDLLVDAQDHDI